MKRIHILYIIFAVFSAQTAYSQNRVGVNTEDPEQLFHIDAKGNTVRTDNTTKTDDVVITSDGTLGIGTTAVKANKKLQVEGDVYISGNVTSNDTLVIDSLSRLKRIGIGTATPQAQLHIAGTGNNSKFRLADTSEKDGYMLTADTLGNARWEPLRPMSSVVYGNVKKDVAIFPNVSGVTYAGPYVVTDTLQLPPGKWLIIANSQTRGTLNWAGSEFTMYFRLYVDYGGVGDTTLNPDFVVTTSATTDLNSTSTKRLSNPQLLYVLEVPVPFDSNGKLQGSDPRYQTKVWMQMVSSGRYGITTGEGSFFAIRIDRHTN